MSVGVVFQYVCVCVIVLKHVTTNIHTHTHTKKIKIKINSNLRSVSHGIVPTGHRLSATAPSSPRDFGIKKRANSIDHRTSHNAHTRFAFLFLHFFYFFWSIAIFQVCLQFVLNFANLRKKKNRKIKKQN